MNQRHAFSLVELSIVLVILGLLTGGILSGQSLMRAAELRDISTNADRFRVGVITFRDKYFAIPGDMADATKFWGVLAGNGADSTCQTTEASGLPTCNGNGDRVIDTSGTGVLYDERFRFWQHLGNAGLIEGSFTGRTDSSTAGSYVMNTGKNTPYVKGGGSFDPFTVSDMTNVGNPGTFQFATATKFLRPYLAYRGKNGTAAPLTPEEVWNLDTKMDDGRPGYGFIVGPQASWTGSPNCTTSDDGTNATYNLARGKEKLCRFDIFL